jgi:hypothetical protein
MLANLGGLVLAFMLAFVFVFICSNAYTSFAQSFGFVV